jgi:hypothetical protein
MVQSDYAAPLVNFKDPKSGQSWVGTMAIISNLIDANTQVAQIPRIPFIENIFSPLATDTQTASQAFYNVMQRNAPSWMDGLHELDTAVGGSTIYGRYSFFQQQFDWLPTWTNLGQSSYHSFQVIVRKRFSSTVQADFNYTLAKALDNGSAVETERSSAGQLLNAFNHRQALGFSSFDIRHQINSNFILALPVGRQRRFGGNMTPVLDGILGGWGLSGLVRWRTGFPFNAINGFNFPTNYFVSGPATLKAGVAVPETSLTKKAAGGPNIFSDPAEAYDAFEYTASGFSGNRNVLHGPGFFALDSSVQKTFKVRERQQIQFRWETFNLTNTVNFDGRGNALNNRGIEVDLDTKASFGRLRSLAGTPRIMQFALRYQF